MLMAEHTQNMRLADILERHRALQRSILNRALSTAESSRAWLGEILINQGLLADHRLATIIAGEFGLPYNTLSEMPVAMHVVEQLPADACRDHLLVPLGMLDGAMQIAVANPQCELLEGLRRQFPEMKVALHVAPIKAIRAAVKRYTVAERTGNAAGDVLDDSKDGNDLSLEMLLTVMAEHHASDLHLTAGSPPLMRVVGDLQQMPFPVLEQDEIKQLVFDLMTGEQISHFERQWELDFSYAQPGGNRFRVNVFRQRGSVGAIFRLVPVVVPTLEQLDMPAVVQELTSRPRGLVLVTGPTGAGKSTTLAAMIDAINHTRHAHIMTIEDPIEFLHINDLSEINQREVGADTHSFNAALRHVLRQDPDVIFIGEMRDLETISAALTAAETGHLVLATLHTVSAAQTVDRIVDVFPPHQHNQVRSQLAMVLEGVISQVLVPNRDGLGRSCAQEIMIGTPAIRTLIRENKVHQIHGMIQTSRKHGMQTLDQSLQNLVERGRITEEEALRWADFPVDLHHALLQDVAEEKCPPSGRSAHGDDHGEGSRRRKRVNS